MTKKLEVIFLDKVEAREQTARGQLDIVHRENLPKNPLYEKVEHQKMYAEILAKQYKCEIVVLPSAENRSDKEIWYCLPKKSN